MLKPLSPWESPGGVFPKDTARLHVVCQQEWNLGEVQAMALSRGADGCCVLLECAGRPFGHQDVSRSTSDAACSAVNSGMALSRAEIMRASHSPGS